MKGDGSLPNDGVLLKVDALRLYFRTASGPVQAVDGVSFELARGRTVALIGESGSGKSSLARAVLRLLPRNVHTYAGSVLLDGLDVMRLDEERFRREVRWVRMALVPQAAMNALNPVVRIEDQIAEPLLIHRRVASRREALQRVQEALRLVGVPLDFLNRYPFELSGGMRQRAAIAMALVTQPQLIILDEPTSALDVLTQANVMNLLKAIKRELGTTFVLITHDVATASELVDDVVVMYAGQVVERADAARFYRDPLHPYSQRLMASVPRLRDNRPLEFIPGRPPSLVNPPRGCRFADRCPGRFVECEKEPPIVQRGDGRWVKCWLYQ